MRLKLFLLVLGLGVNYISYASATQSDIDEGQVAAISYKVFPAFRLKVEEALPISTIIRRLSKFLDLESASCLYGTHRNFKDIYSYVPHQLNLTPQNFIKWSEHRRPSNILLTLSLDMSKDTELNKNFWKQLTDRAPYIISLGFLNQFYYLDENIRPNIHLYPLNSLLLFRLEEFFLVGLNPGYEFLSTLTLASFCKNLKKMHLLHLGKLMHENESADGSLKLISYLKDIPSLKNLDFLGFDSISKPAILKAIASSPYLRLGQLQMNAQLLTVEDALKLSRSNLFQKVYSLILSQINNSLILEILLASPALKNLKKLALIISPFDTNSLLDIKETLIRLSLENIKVLAQSSILENLTHFAFSGCFNKEVGYVLGTSTHLKDKIRYLSLESWISLKGIDSLFVSSKMQSIETVILSGDGQSPIVLNTLEAMNKNRNLKKLTSLGIKRVPSSTLKTFFTFPNFNTLRTLEISHSLSEEEATLLLENQSLFPNLHLIYEGFLFDPSGKRPEAFNKRFRILPNYSTFYTCFFG